MAKSHGSFFIEATCRHAIRMHELVSQFLRIASNTSFVKVILGYLVQSRQNTSSCNFVARAASPFVRWVMAVRK